MRGAADGKIICDRECREIVEKKLIDEALEDYRLVNYDVKPVGEVNGFMGRYYKLTATVGRDDEPTDTRVYNFFTKIPPPACSPQYDWIQEYGSFEKEVYLYTTVFPELFDGTEKFFIPRCFLGLGNDVIVLEDMAESGYAMTDKLVDFDVRHCRVVLRQIAKFHAKTLIFEETWNKNLHDEFTDCMRETLWPVIENGMAKRMFDAAVKGVISMIDLVDDLDDMQRNDLKIKIQSSSYGHAEKLSPSTKFRNVLCHGDLWANNILFKHDEDGNPTSCCLVDFQLARYNPPAHDIMCFLQFTTTRESRQRHLNDLLEIYWNEMAASLKTAGLEASAVFPWDELVASITELRTTCMTHGILNIPIMLLEPKAASKYFDEEPKLLETVLYVDRTPLITGQFNQVTAYRERMIDAVLEFHECSS